MKKRPLPIIVISIFLFMSPVWILGQIIITQYLKYDVLKMPNILNNYQALVLLCLSPVVGYGVLSVKKWGFHLLLFFSTITIVNNIIVQYLHKTVFPLSGILLCNIVILGVMIIFCRKEIYSPYFNPNLRWWEEAKRFYCPDMHIDVYSIKDDKKITESTAFDISETGFYAVHKENFNLGEKFLVKIYFSDKFILTAEAESVWKNSGSDKIPPGYGCRFIKTKSSFRKIIRREINNVRLVLRERN